MRACVCMCVPGRARGRERGAESSVRGDEREDRSRSRIICPPRTDRAVQTVSTHGQFTLTH